jgi:hypothetical protein
LELLVARYGLKNVPTHVEIIAEFPACHAGAVTNPAVGGSVRRYASSCGWWITSFRSIEFEHIEGIHPVRGSGPGWAEPIELRRPVLVHIITSPSRVAEVSRNARRCPGRGRERVPSRDNLLRTGRRTAMAPAGARALSPSAAGRHGSTAPKSPRQPSGHGCMLWRILWRFGTVFRLVGVAEFESATHSSRTRCTWVRAL